MVMVPQMGEKKGKSGCWGGTKGAAPGPRRGRGAECPWATRGTFYAPVVGGGAPESASAASQAPDVVITSNFSESYEHFAGLLFSKKLKSLLQSI